MYVEDAGSTNGTFVNGIRLARERGLPPGDVVRVGETDLRFELSAFPEKIAIGQRNGESDTGRKRRRNEDNFVCDPPCSRWRTAWAARRPASSRRCSRRTR